MQAILGAGGAIGKELARALRIYSKEIRLVSRTPQKVNDQDQLFPADLTIAEQVNAAVEGAEVVYLTAGLPYNLKIWQRDWPVIMENVINACILHDSRLVFFDNIYMYDGDHLNQIMETHTVNPPSKKGKVRAEIVNMIWAAARMRGLIALVARCADFYGPSISNVSILTELVIKPLHSGKAANWMVSDRYKHAFTYTVDAASATALLGNSKEAFGQTWHLPTAKQPLTGREWVELVAKEFGVKPKRRVVGKTLTKIMGYFNPVMKEMHEMLYQYDKDYVFNSDKFERQFAFKPTSYEDGIREIILTDYPN